MDAHHRGTPPRQTNRRGIIFNRNQGNLTDNRSYIFASVRRTCVSNHRVSFLLCTHFPKLKNKNTATKNKGVVLKGVFPQDGGTPTVKLAAGTWDSGVFRSSGDGGRAKDATMAYPKGIAVDESNTFYVTEFHGAKIRAVTTAVEISTCAGTGVQVSYPIMTKYTAKKKMQKVGIQIYSGESAT